MATKWREGWAVRLESGKLLRGPMSKMVLVYTRKSAAEERAAFTSMGRVVRVRYCEPVVIETKKARGK